MANLFGPQTIVIDTAFEATSDTSLECKKLIQGFFWDAGASDLGVAVTDGSNQVWAASSTTNEQNISMEFSKSINVDNLGVSTLGGGTLFIYTS